MSLFAFSKKITKNYDVKKGCVGLSKKNHEIYLWSFNYKFLLCHEIEKKDCEQRLQVKYEFTICVFHVDFVPEPTKL